MTQEKKLHIFIVYGKQFFLPFPTTVKLVPATSIEEAMEMLRHDPTIPNTNFTYGGSTTKDEVVKFLEIQTVILNMPPQEAKVEETVPVDYNKLGQILFDNASLHNWIVRKKKNL